MYLHYAYTDKKYGLNYGNITDTAHILRNNKNKVRKNYHGNTENIR